MASNHNGGEGRRRLGLAGEGGGDGGVAGARGTRRRGGGSGSNQTGPSRFDQWDPPGAYLQFLESLGAYLQILTNFFIKCPKIMKKYIFGKLKISIT